MRFRIVLASLLLAASIACAQKPEAAQPSKVDPGAPGKAPSDAVVLFNGTDLSGWVDKNGRPAAWSVRDGAIVCQTGKGHIYSRERFRAAQIHLEFNVPRMPEEKGQRRGNSGVYLLGRYEIQVLDSYENPTYANGSCGALYGQSAPMVNASLPPGQWQTYDIVFHPPRCGKTGATVQPGSLTLFHNGILVQDHVPVESKRGCVEEGPLMLQDHQVLFNPPKTDLKFRNIWLRRLPD